MSLVEKDGAIAVVTLNRPQALNALSYALVKDLSLAHAGTGSGQ